MKFGEFKVIAVTLKTVYPTLKAFDTEEGILIWFEMLKDLDYPMISKTVDAYAKENPFPPTVADLRRYEKIISGNDWSIAWNKLKSGAKMKEVDYPGQYAYATIGEKVFEESYDIRVMLEFKKLYQEFCLMDNQVKGDIFRSGLLKCRDEDKKQLGQDDGGKQLFLSE